MVETIMPSLGWKPIPSGARVTRDEVSGLQNNYVSCLEDSILSLSEDKENFFKYNAFKVLSSRQLCLFIHNSRDRVPGYSRFARYRLPA